MTDGQWYWVGCNTWSGNHPQDLETFKYYLPVMKLPDILEFWRGWSAAQEEDDNITGD